MQTSVLGRGIARIVNVLNAFKTFTVNLFILTLIFTVFWSRKLDVKKIGRKIYTTVFSSDMKAFIKH